MFIDLKIDNNYYLHLLKLVKLSLQTLRLVNCGFRLTVLLLCL